jgi:hypothetical protein
MCSRTPVAAAAGCAEVRQGLSAAVRSCARYAAERSLRQRLQRFVAPKKGALVAHRYWNKSVNHHWMENRAAACDNDSKHANQVIGAGLNRVMSLCSL